MIADLAVLRDQADLFGPVASDATAWRVLSRLASAALARLRTARAVAREVAWAQLAETRGQFPAAVAARQCVDALVLDQAVEQIADSYRFGRDILVRTDSAGCSLGFSGPIRSLREHGMRRSS